MSASLEQTDMFFTHRKYFFMYNICQINKYSRIVMNVLLIVFQVSKMSIFFNRAFDFLCCHFSPKEKQALTAMPQRNSFNKEISILLYFTWCQILQEGTSELKFANKVD